ncbi:MAG: competence/damage-inducible protein A [Gemmatimonadaceae bacterium]
MNVELVTIGTELLLGYTIDTNAAYFAREAAAQGIRVVRRTTCGDGPEEIAAVVREALARTGAVITSGGLGPTADDLTKPAIAALFERAMLFDEAIHESLKARWKARGWPGELPEANRSQAMIPAGATILANRHGSAPGIWLEDADGRWVAMLPGVPREFRGMCADELLPRLTRLLRAAGSAAGAAPRTVVRSRTLRTTGVAESALADALGELAKDALGVGVAYLPGWDGVDLRLTVWDAPEAEAAARIAAAEAALRAKVGRWIYGEDDADLAALVLTALRERGMRLAVAESCTGGMLGMRLTAIPGSSDVVEGGTIAYANAVKVRELGVSEATIAAHGAVSEEVAREMARGARARFGVDVGMSITGVAGPGGGTPEKPVGTFCVAVDLRGDVESRRTNSVGDRHEVRQRSTQAALGLLWRLLARG